MLSCKQKITEINCQFSQDKIFHKMNFSWSSVKIRQFLWAGSELENQSGEATALIWKDYSGIVSLTWDLQSGSFHYLMNWWLFWGRWCNVLTYQCLSPVWGSLWGRGQASIEPLSDPTTALGSQSDKHDTQTMMTGTICSSGLILVVFVCILWSFFANMLNVAPLCTP